MTNAITFLVAEGSLPLEHGNNPLLPSGYDVVWSVVPLIVILIIFGKFVLPPFRKILDERAEAIEGGITRAEQAQAEAKEALERYNAKLATAGAEADAIREEARGQGAKIVADAKDKATEESNRIIESGEKQLQASREQVIAQLRRELGQTSIDLAERLLGEQLADDVKRSGTIDNFLAELDHVSPAGK